MIFTDTHTHLYDEQLAPDEAEMIQRALDAGVRKMYMPNCDSSTVEGMLRIAAAYPQHCYPMMGLHPCYVKENYKDELALVEEQLSTRKFYAVGEIGLDYYWDLTFKEQQIEAFEYQIDQALQYQLPVVIHSRESLQDCIDIVRVKQNGKLKGIFHCFSGNEHEAQQIVELGMFLGIGGVLTFKNSKLPDAIKNISLDNIVLETDAPYLAPAPYRGKRNESSYIPIIAEKLADIKQVSIEQIAEVTTHNSDKIFGRQ
ncbi:MAG: TatD family hydrolase [Taibaiella sp.]|nr:TatD family hydrolase [Taibaiella sp.]